MGNHLINQSSPYLLQHAENPVDWYPWGEEAFQKAEREEKPVFLSIGYSTCHWCHAMAHESFEEKEIADILNRHFVSIKVDREERPDIDSVYMSVCQALTGSGGWPMSIFMTAKQKPFYAGTYFPPVSRHGMVGFKELLLAIARKWEEEKASLCEAAENIVDEIVRMEEGKEDYGTGRTWDKYGADDVHKAFEGSLSGKAARMISGNFDAAYGGFGEAPKFPMPHNLIFLMMYACLEGRKGTPGKREKKKLLSGKMEDGQAMILEQVRMTLEQMRRGGIFDQIGYGFCRYSTDRIFLVPHFEKMLYDNALLIMAYAVAYCVFGENMFLDTARKTAAYVLREMTGDEGGFYSAQDADSGGGEGRFYVWSPEEVCEVLGEEKGRRFCEYFGITKQGNFEGKSIPHLLNGSRIPDEFAQEREILYRYRASRMKLHLDDKVLTAWNGLMICAMSMLYRVTGAEVYLLAAQKAERFLAASVMEGNVIYVGCRQGVRLAEGYLDDYACMAAAYLSLYGATAGSAYLKRAEQICKEAQRQFADEKGGYFLYGTLNSDLIMRLKEDYDGALPSGNAIMAYCLVRLSQLMHWEDDTSVLKQLGYLAGKAADYPAGHTLFLIALLYEMYPPQKITVVLGEDGADKPADVMARMPLYADVTVLDKATAQYPLLNNRTTYYVCRNHNCLPPVNEAELAASVLGNHKKWRATSVE